MTTSYALDGHFEAFVQAQLSSGRYPDGAAVLRDALRPMEDQQEKLGALEIAIAAGMTDLHADRIYDLDKVCDELDGELATLASSRAP